ncbi:MAG: hypothetical protein KKG93_09095 [Bacteroidetes bacterium]|nr:hypothetical protein [Bacteroidota bacterium]
MKNPKSIFTLLFASLLLATFFSACQSDQSLVSSDENQINQEVFAKLIEDDELLQSFDLNYDEEDAMAFLGTLGKKMYPIKVGQRIKLVDKNIVISEDGDIATGTVTKVFAGVLIIAATYAEPVAGERAKVDTVLYKEFTTTVKYNVVLEKVDQSINPLRNWKIVSSSLAAGGTETENIQITKMVVTLPDGQEIEVTDPTEYFITRDHSVRGMLHGFTRGDVVKVRVEVTSAYADEDFLSLTYGAFRGGKHFKAKKKLELASSSEEGGVYKKVYEGSWTIREHRAYKYAIVNAVPNQVIYDDEAPVELVSWGIPYKVN